MTSEKLSRNSSDSFPSELDLFQAPVQKTGILEGEWIEKTPHGGIASGDSPIEFLIDGSTDHYIDLNNTFLSIQCHVKKYDGTLLPEDSAVIPANYLLHTLFQSLDIEINGIEVEHESNYAYRAYLETLLNHGTEAKSTHLATSMWYNNIPPKATADYTDHELELAAPLASKIAKRNMIDMIGRIHSDLFHQIRYLIPGMNIRIQLRRNNSRFVLEKLKNSDTNEYIIDLVKAELLVRRVKVHPTVYTTHHQLLGKGHSVQYPINHVETMFFTVSSGRQDQNITVLQNRQIPKRLLFCLVNHSAKNGSYQTNPFAFHHYNMSSCNLIVDGHPVLNKPLKMSVENGIYMRAYFNLLSVSGKALLNEGTSITHEDFVNGKCIIAFDLAPDLCQGDGVHAIKHGTTSLELAFSSPLPHTISVFVYCEFDDLIEINNSRVATFATRST